MFFTTTDRWADLGARAMNALADRYGSAGLHPGSFGLVMLQPGPSGRAEGFAHRGDWRCYPCSLVKAFHLVHALCALDGRTIAAHPELDRAMADMITWSSNTATNYVIDILTGTTGDTLLDPAELAAWTGRRDGLNRFFQSLDWPEFAGCNITQKLMDDVRYGREAQYAGRDGANLNALTPLAAARLLWELFEGDLPLSPMARARAQATLGRDTGSPEAAHPNYQVSEYLGGQLPAGVGIHSKAGHNLWTGDPRASYFKHDMIRVQAEGQPPLTLVLMTQGKTICEDRPAVFPEIGRLLFDLATESRLADVV